MAPPADHMRLKLRPHTWLHIQEPRASRAQKPLVSMDTQQVDAKFVHVEFNRTATLSRIHIKQSRRVTHAANLRNRCPKTRDIIERTHQHQTRPRIQMPMQIFHRRLDQLNSLARKQTRCISVIRKLRVQGNHAVARLPFDSIQRNGQPMRSRGNHGDIGRLGMDQPGQLYAQSIEVVKPLGRIHCGRQIATLQMRNHCVRRRLRQLPHRRRIQKSPGRKRWKSRPDFSPVDYLSLVWIHAATSTSGTSLIVLPRRSTTSTIP